MKRRQIIQQYRSNTTDCTNVTPANTDKQTVLKPMKAQAKSSVCPIKFMDRAIIEAAFVHTLILQAFLKLL